MTVKNYLRSFVSLAAFLLLLFGKCSNGGMAGKMNEEKPDEHSTTQTHVFEAAENTKIKNVTEHRVTTVAAARGAASDTKARRQRSSFPAFSFDSDVDTRNESSNQCEKARRCSWNNDNHTARCSCHSHCHLFGDCCEDAVHSNNSKYASRLPRTGYSCYLCNSPFAKAVNIITSCHEQYEIDAVVQACNRSKLFLEHDPSQDSISTPVTDGSTGLTYGNLFCAICWDANPETSEPWLWNFYCNNKKVGTKTVRTTTASFLSKLLSNFGEETGISTLTYLRTMCKSSFAPPRRFSTPLTECDPMAISNCPSSFDPTDELVTLCDDAPFRSVYFNQVTYRNLYCLACNNVEYRNLSWSCVPPLKSTSPKWNFTILVSPSRESCDVNARSSQWTIKNHDLCSRLARCIAQDRQSIKCTGVCPFPIFHESKCPLLNVTALCSFDEALEDSPVNCSYLSLFSSDPLIVQLNPTPALCYTCVLKSFENYTMINGPFAAAVNGSSKFYSSVITYVKEGLLSAFISEPLLTTLAPMENDGTRCYSQTLHWGFPLTTYLISQCCLIVYFVLYAASQRLRGFLGEIVLNKSVAFFFGGTFFALRWITDNSLTLCRPLHILCLYFYNAAFTWSSIFAIEVARALSVVVSTAQLNSVNRRRIAYYVVGWGASLLVVLFGVAADELGLEVRPDYGTWQCWYSTALGMLVYAVAPLGLCLTIDMVAYIYVIVRLAVLERQTRIARETRREKMLLAVKLLLAIGLQWAFVLTAGFIEDDWVKCAFKVTGSLQGIFILLIFGIKRDVLSSLKCCPKPPESQVSRQTSSTVVTNQAAPQLPQEASVPGSS